MTRLLIISNGHGEDFIAARLGEALRTRMPEIEIEAFPLVGDGEQLRAAGLNVNGPTKVMPSGGLTLHHPSFLWRDLRAGLVALTLRQVAYLRRARPHAVLVVGDVYAQMHATQVRAPRRVLQPLVSVHHHLRVGDPEMGGLGEGAPSSPLRYFMERFRGPELFLLKQAQRVYARDAATADFLRQLGVTGCTYLGNPMMDGLAARPLWPAAARAGGSGSSADEPAGPVVALLPGTRAQANRSVALMFDTLRHVERVHGLVAWARPEVPLLAQGWRAAPIRPEVRGLRAVWRAQDGDQEVWWLEGRFASVLATAHAAMGTSGTANEQAVGLGLPVVSFEVPPLFSREFLRNQQRLLGAGLLVGRPEPAELARLLDKALHDEGVRAEAVRIGKERMGGPGASAALADDLAEWLGSRGQHL